MSMTDESRTRPAARTLLLASAFALCAALASCDVEAFRGFPSDKPPIHPVLDMDFQPKVRAQSELEFEGWKDHRGARRPVHDTFGNTLVVARDSLPDPKLAHRDQNGQFVTENPLPLSAKIVVSGREMSVIDRGRERFDIYCSVCHGYSGRGGFKQDAHGMVGRHWSVVVPSFHVDPNGDATANRVPNMPDGEYFEKITNGYGTMPAYGARITAEDRWAIIHYVRALQSLSN